MTDQGMSHHSIELVICKLKTLRISGPELYLPPNPILRGQAGCCFRQIRTEVNPHYLAGELSPQDDRARGDPGPTAEIQDSSSRVNLHRLQIVLQHIDKEGVMPSGLKPGDHDVKRCRIKLIRHAKDICGIILILLE